MGEIKEANSRALFEIVAIDLDSGTIVYESKVIAEGEKEALFESDLKEKLAAKKMTREDVHILVREFGQVPAKCRMHKFVVKGRLGKHLVAKEEN